MQTTLLGLAIAFIIALAAALIGPQFVDWNQFRPQFEAEASRVLGTPVHVGGTLDARLLPTPTLRLRAVEIGNGAAVNGAVSKLSAKRLDVEFALGSLLRGEWRADELSLDGLDLEFGLDPRGRIEWPLSGASADLGSLAIDRLNLSGRVEMRDAASGSIVNVENLVFAGDVRALAGTLRGDGKFTVAGVRTPFRVSTGQTSDGKGTRVRFIVDPGERPLSAELDGVLSFDAMSPRFEGAMTLTHPVAAKPSDPKENPWRISSRVKATPSSAALEQIELGYGPDDNALKLTGAGDVAFGASPLLRASLSARQIDIDRLRGSGDEQSGETDKLAEARRWMSSLPAAPFPVRLELAADQIALGGRPIQNVSATINGDATAWGIDNITLLAPGATRVSLRGAVSPLGPSAAFAGPLQIDAADPVVFSNWLGETRLSPLFGRKPARLKGDVRLAADRIALDKVEADFGGGPIEGGGSYSPGKFELALKAQDFNFDNVMDLSASLPPRNAWPDDIRLSVDVAKATLAGREFRSAGIGLVMNGNGLALDRFSLGEGSDLAISGNGAIDRATAKGHLTLNATAASLGSLSGLIEPYAPQIATRLNAVSSVAGPARAQLTASSAAAQAGRGDMRFNLKLDTAQANATAELKATPAFDPARGFELDQAINADAALDVSVSARRSDFMLAMLSLDKVLSPGDGAAQLNAMIAGKWKAPLRGKVSVSAVNFAGEAQGIADPWAADPNASINLTVSRADISALFGLKPNAATALNVSGSSRLAMAGNIWKFDEIDSRFGASQVRGKAILTRGDEVGIDSQLELDQLDLASVFGVAAGTFGKNVTEPLGRGMVQGWRGKIGFKAARASWPGGTEMASLSGIVSSSGQSVRLEDAKADIGGGKADIGLEMAPSADGLSIAARAQLTNADASVLIYRNLKMPASRVSLRATLTSRGRSAGALSGALSGEGLVTLDDVRIAGLEPRVFDIASRASDTAQITDDLKLKELVDPFMASGQLKATSSQIPFSIQSGRLKVVMTPIEATDARAVLSGGYDIPADQVDIRAGLSPLKTSAKNGTPEVALYLHGTPDAMTRSLDVSSLSSWLALRAIDRETRRLDRIERGPSSAALPDDDETAKDALSKPEALPSSDVKMPKRNPRRAPQQVAPSSAPGANSTNAQAQPLPPPIEVRPAPSVARQPPKPRPPLQLSPPSGSLF